MRARRSVTGFTLIELLIVVAIIAILAAIAVPNFLEAQTRSKVSRAKADMRSLITGFESYRVDHSKLPPPFELFAGTATNQVEWWGFTPMLLTTPIAYMASLPSMPFPDEWVSDTWKAWSKQSAASQPYTYIYDMTGVSMAFYNQTTPFVPGHAPQHIKNYLTGRYIPADAKDYGQQAMRSAYVLYTSGPDKFDGTVWIAPMTYDPTNGTVSYGDIHAFGAGTQADSGKSWNTQ